MKIKGSFKILNIFTKHTFLGDASSLKCTEKNVDSLKYILQQQSLLFKMSPFLKTHTDCKMFSPL